MNEPARPAFVRTHAGRSHQIGIQDKKLWEEYLIEAHGPVIQRVIGGKPADRIGAALLRRAHDTVGRFKGNSE